MPLEWWRGTRARTKLNPSRTCITTKNYHWGENGSQDLNTGCHRLTNYSNSSLCSAKELYDIKRIRDSNSFNGNFAVVRRF